MSGQRPSDKATARLSSVQPIVMNDGRAERVVDARAQRGRGREMTPAINDTPGR